MITYSANTLFSETDSEMQSLQSVAKCEINLIYLRILGKVFRVYLLLWFTVSFSVHESLCVRVRTCVCVCVCVCMNV